MLSTDSKLHAQTDFTHQWIQLNNSPRWQTTKMFNLKTDSWYLENLILWLVLCPYWSTASNYWYLTLICSFLLHMLLTFNNIDSKISSWCWTWRLHKCIEREEFFLLYSSVSDKFNHMYDTVGQPEAVWVRVSRIE